MPAEGADGDPASDALGEAEQIGLDAEVLVGPAPRQDDAGLDLVEDEHRAVLGGELADALEEPGIRRDDADVELHRLDDDGGDFAGVRLQDPGEQLRLVERRDHRLGDPAARDPGAGRHGRRRLDGAHRLARRLDADQHVIVVAVVAALELDDLLAAGVAPRDANGVHGGLGAGVAEADEVGAESGPDLLGQRDPVLDRERVAGAVGDPVLERLGQEWMRVSGGQDAEGHVEVDVLVAVGVPDAAAARIGHEGRIRVIDLERAGHPERQRLARTLEQGGALCRPLSVGRLLARADLGDASPIDLTSGDRHDPSYRAPHW